VEGHVEDFRSLTPYDPVTARALLDKFGYLDRDRDGFRELPDGRPLTIHHVSTTGAVYRQFDDLWLKSARDIGIRMDFDVQPFTEAIKAAHAGKVQFSGFGWSGDVPDNYLRQFYGPGAGAANIARFRSPEYDAMYEKARRTPDRAERNRLYAAMTKLVAAQSPWCLGVYRISNTVLTAKMRGYRKNVHYFVEPWQYLDVDTAARAASR
jgi:ABC-type transport system substrate-binding protein